MQPPYGLVCRDETAEDSETRVQGRPYVKTVDSDFFEMVHGGFRPHPLDLRLGDIPVPSA